SYPDQTVTPSSRVLAQRVPLGAGRASVTAAALSSGSHFVTAALDGTQVAIGLMQKVHRSATSTALFAWLAPPRLALSAAVYPDARGGTPTGMVTFLESGRVLAQVPLARSGITGFDTSTLGTGSHTLTAIYASDPLFASST